MANTNDSVISIEDSFVEETSTEEIMELYRLPSPLREDGHLGFNWKIFKQEFDIFLTASEKKKKSKEIKAAIFLNLVGDYGRQLFNNFNMSEEDATDIDKVVVAFENYCAPKKNVVYERFKFNQRHQKEGKTFENFLASIQKLIRTCEYGTEEDNILRDQIVLGISDNRLQEKLLAREEALTSDKAISLCRSAEMARQQATVLQQCQQHTSSHIDSISAKCKKCNYNHEPAKCPAYGKKCNTCSRFNHFSTCCNVRSNKKIDTINVVEEDDYDSLYIG